MSKVDTNIFISAVLINAIPKDWMRQMPIHMISLAAAESSSVHGYAKTATLLRDLADIIENTGMKLEFPNGN